MLAVVMWPIRVILSSFAVWVVLTTILPQTVVKYVQQEAYGLLISLGKYPYSLLLENRSTYNSTVVAVIAHPDDEVMFFGPTLVELAKEKYGNSVQIVCFSLGDADSEGMGQIRSRELEALARILGAHGVHMIPGFKDGMEENWDLELVAQNVEKQLANIQKAQPKRPVVVITFDDQGVLGHPNHVALYNGVKKWWGTRGRKQQQVLVLCLKLLLFLEKYSFTILTNVELFVEHISGIFLSLWKVNLNILFFKGAETVRFYCDLNMLAVEYAAMAYGHFSQMVWFRYGWLCLSRYLTFNELVPMK